MKTRMLFATLLFVVVGRILSQDVQRELPRSFTVRVTNPVKAQRENVLVFIPEVQLKKITGFNPNAFIVTDRGQEIPSQYNARDKEFPGIVSVLTALKSGEARDLVVRFKTEGELKRNYPKKTQAELSPKTGGKFIDRKYIGGQFQNVDHLTVDGAYKDHAYYIRYEGPGWESDKVGYRFYLDQRNATDVFGKRTNDMALHQVGLDGFESYHNMQPWGMDVMKVNKSLGLGSIGTLHQGAAMRVEKRDSAACRITENGNVYSSITTDYYGWQPVDTKYTVQSHIGIHAGTRLSHQMLSVTGGLANLCTGIIKDKNATPLTSKGDAQHWGYLATYGKQSLTTEPDELGLVVFFNPKDFTAFTEDANSHIVTLKPSNGKLEYYYAACWVQEPDGIRNEKQFQEYIHKVSEELANPVKVQIVNAKK